MTATDPRAGLGTPLLTAVVVHWRTPELLAELLAAWPRDPRFELVVVDNSGEAVPGPQPSWLHVLRPGRNLGFAGGANAGLAVARAPLVLILNPDAVPEPGALDSLLEGFALHPDAAGLAPRLLGEGGGSQAAWQLRPLPSPWQCLRHTLPLAAPGAFNRSSDRGGRGGRGNRHSLPARPGSEPEPREGEPVAQPAAAALALRRQVLGELGGFDERFYPAWFEDVDLARRLHDAGRVLLYWPRACFRHRLGSTVERLGYGPFLWIYSRNLARYLAKHHGAAWALAASAGTALGAFFRLLLLPLRRPRRAASRREAAHGLALLLAGGLSGFRRPAALRRLVTPPTPPTPPTHPTIVRDRELPAEPLATPPVPEARGR